MNYKDTVLKQNQIKWRRPPVKYIEDGKLDVVVSIPLTRVIEGQAQISFAWGCFEALSWLGDTQQKQIKITSKMLEDKMKEWGVLKMYTATLKAAKEAKNK
jgi:hypothetical protein